MAAEQEIIDCLQLINSENVGPITFFKLLEVYGDSHTALENLQHSKKIKLFPRHLAELEFKQAQEKGITILLHSDAEYPINLKNLEDRPPILYALGRLSCLKTALSISIVGARNASIKGRKTASKIAYGLTNNNVVVISGLARGIDAAAHKGALYAQNQQGTTIAVLGCGVDVVYPKENTDLYQQIAQQGLILSEFPLGTQPQANNFPRRNRIVAALSLGTLVVEATANSGSLITARLALEQGKDIFAIPGSPDEPRSAGPNRLLKEGAYLVENEEDILNILCSNNPHEVQKQMALELSKPMAPTQKKAPPLATAHTTTKLDFHNQPSVKIIDYLNSDGVYVDEIIRSSGLDAATVATMLLELELEGKIIRQVGNKVALIK